MSSPTVKVEIDFTSAPLSSTRSWTDVSAYVRLTDGVRWSRGRTDERAATGPGSCTFTLNNDDGRFTPGNDAGPYDPIGLTRPVRVSVLVGEDYVTRWTGFVDEWATAWTAGVRGVTRVSCTDLVGLLQRRPLPGLLEAQARALSPVFWVGLDSPTGATGTGGLQWGADSGPEADRLPALNLMPTDYIPDSEDSAPYVFRSGSAVTRSDLPEVDGDGFTLVFWFRWHDWPRGLLRTLGLVRTPDATSIGAIDDTTPIILRPQRNLYVRYDDAVAEEYLDLTSVTDEDWATWHMVAYRVSSTTTDLWLDNASAELTAVPVPSIPAGGTWTFGAAAVEDGDGDIVTGYHCGSIGRVAVWDRALSDNELMTLYGASPLAGTSQTTAARFESVCRVAGLDASLYDVDGSTTVPFLSLRSAGGDPVSLVSEAAQVERGAFWVTADGVLTFQTAAARAAETLAVSLDQSEVGSDLSFEWNDRYLINDVRARSEVGDEVSATDDSSVAVYGVYTLSADLSTTTAHAQAWADSVLADYRYMAARCDAVDVDLVAKAATVDVADVLSADVSSVIEVTGLPVTGSPASTATLRVEGISEQVTPSSWLVSFRVSPEGFSRPAGRVAVGAASEVSTAGAVVAQRAYPVGSASESDTAQAVTV